MPFIIDTGGNQFVSGMKRQLIIDTASRRTGRVAEGKLNLNTEYMDALQAFCSEHWWWWRRKTVAFVTTPGISVYDLADPQSPVNALDCQKVRLMQLFLGPGSYTEVPPIFGDDDQQVALEDTTTQGPPAGYFMVPGSTSQIQLTPIPDQAYRLRFHFWAMPNATIDTLDDVPLIPGHLTRLLIAKLQINILAFAACQPGGGAYATALEGVSQKYMDDLTKASAQRDFADGNAPEWKSQEDAVQSH